MTAHRGFALLAVLWIVIAATAFAMAAHAVTRQALDGASNRAALTRARWRAADCLERTRASIGAALAHGAAADNTVLSSAFSELSGSWLRLDAVLDGTRLLPIEGCEVHLRAVGSRVDVNTTSDEMLRVVLDAMAVSAARADSLVDALLDWRDGDDISRELGVERSWYAGERRLLPRNGPIADPRELRLVRGFEALAIDSVLGVESGRIALDQAPIPVLMALPGFGSEVVGRIIELRARGQPVSDLITLGGSISPAAREAMLARYADLVRLTTVEPDAWIVTARGHSGTPEVTYAIELRLVRAGDRAAVVRRRSWIE